MLSYRKPVAIGDAMLLLTIACNMKCITNRMFVWNEGELSPA